MTDPHATDQVVPTDLASVHLAAIRKRWWLPVSGLVIVGLVAYLVAASGPKRYDASASVLLTSVEPIGLLPGANNGPINPDQERALNTEVALVKLRSTAASIRQQLGLSLTSDDLLSEISVTPQGTTNLIQITARDADPAQAAGIADAFAKQYVAVRRQLAQDAFAQAAGLAAAQLAALTPSQADGPEGHQLKRTLRQLTITGGTLTGETQLVDRATVPTTPATPKPKFPALVGALLGGLLGALAAIGWGAADRSARRRPDDQRRSWSSRLRHRTPAPEAGPEQIGRASCRERV